MATFSEQTDLVVDTVRDYRDLAESAYQTARQTLDVLSSTVTELPLTVVDTEIGANLSISWANSIVTPTAPDEPTWIDSVVDGLGSAPTVPTTTLTIPDFTEDAPDALTGSVGTPSDPFTGDYPTVPTLGTVPTIGVVVPTIDIAVLATEFDFTEPTFTGKISSDLETEVLRVLGGDLGIPQTHWDLIWGEAAADIAQERVGALRNARNRGAATYWALPSEAALVGTQAVQDETARALQKIRLEQAVERGKMAREDFWAAVEKGLTYEGMWVGFHSNLAQRALAAAEQLAKIAIETHNANVARFNLLLDGAKTDLAIDQADVSRTLTSHELSLKEAGQILEGIKLQVEEYQAQWTAKVGAFNADSTRGTQGIQRFSELVKVWATQADTEIKAKTFPLDKAKIEASIYQTQYGALDAAAKATAAIMDSRNATQKLLVDSSVAKVDHDAKKNQVEVAKGSLAQAAQESKAKIDVAQAEWTAGQASALQQRISELAFGWAQAAVAASHVSLSSGSDLGIRQSISASQNQELEWNYIWG
jgi:hypothetical protein